MKRLFIKIVRKFLENIVPEVFEEGQRALYEAIEARQIAEEAIRASDEKECLFFRYFHIVNGEVVARNKVSK